MGVTTAEQTILDHFCYRSYVANRSRFPLVSWARWAAIYGSDTARMEGRYQQDGKE